MKYPFANRISEVERQFDIIKKSKAALYSFFSMMPKGGDLHHHFASTVYVEHYIDYLLKQDYFINIKNLLILVNLDNVKEGKDDFIALKSLAPSEIIEYKLKLMKEWNVKDYYTLVATDLHFFAVFAYFDMGNNNFNYKESLKKLKSTALSQKISYIESMFLYCNPQNIKSAHAADLSKSNEALIAFNQKLNLEQNPLSQKNYLEFKALIKDIYAQCQSHIKATAQQHNETIANAVSENINDENFVIKFQNFVFRNEMPMDVFISMAVSFQSASTSEHISGVNICSVEHGATALDYYNLHMLFYQFFEEEFPNEKYAIHAGEFTANSVKATHLGKHVSKALTLKNVRRIAHGLDIIYDSDFLNTIQHIQKRNIISKELANDYELNFDVNYLEECFNLDKDYLAFECNFSMNKHLLNLEEDTHPATIFLKHNIPMVICSDDEGVISTNMTEQFVKLVSNFGYTYKDIKKMCFDSIRYANIKNIGTKKNLFKKLLKDFEIFENEIEHLAAAYQDKSAKIGFKSV